MNFKDIQKLKDSLDIKVEKANINQLKILKNKAKTLKDNRVKKKCTYKLFLKLTGGIPTPSTYERVISIIDSHELNNLCVEFIFKLIEIPINPRYEFLKINFDKL